MDGSVATDGGAALRGAALSTSGEKRRVTEGAVTRRSLREDSGQSGELSALPTDLSRYAESRLRACDWPMLVCDSG
jgi:hypothetical protein